MARFAASCKVNASRNSFDVGHITDVVNGGTVVAHGTTVTSGLATVSASMATLVADGASPTSAHVSASNAAFNTLSASVVTYQTDVQPAPANADVVISFDAAAVVTKSKLRHAVLALLNVIEGSNDLTP